MSVSVIVKAGVGVGFDCLALNSVRGVNKLKVVILKMRAYGDCIQKN